MNETNKPKQSVKSYIKSIRKSNLRASHKLLALMHAYNADEETLSSRALVKDLAKDCQFTESSVCKMNNALEHSGWITIIKKKGSVNTYQLSFPQISDSQAADEVEVQI